jgi:hydroxymethylpyrimidine/phosphomethylpyrimidine kinase
LLTVQSSRALSRVQHVDAALVAEQLDAVLDDLPPQALKTGALGSQAIVEAIANRIAKHEVPLVIDPVLSATHGAVLLESQAQQALRERLLPLATLVAPNLAEAEALTGRPVRTEAQARDAARALVDLGAGAALVTGGHLDGDAVDTLYVGGEWHRLVATRIETRHTHGLGCALSAAITARLAHGEPLLDACERAKHWLTRAIANAPGLGGGAGPIDHFTKPDDIA